MPRASKRSGYGQNRGALNPRFTYTDAESGDPKDGDRWLDSDDLQEYVYDKASLTWLPIGGGAYGGGSLTGLVWANTDVVTTVSALQTVAYVTATAERTATLIATACINGNADTTMSVTSYVMLNETTVNTLIKTVPLGYDDIVNIALTIKDVPAGTNDIWIQQTVNTGNWELDASEQHLYVLTFYENVSIPSPYSTTAYAFNGTVANDTDEYIPDTWTSKTSGDSPIVRECEGTNIESDVYLFGGFTGSVYRQDTRKYSSDVWTAMTNTSYLTYGHDSCTIDSKAYMICGAVYLTGVVKYCEEYTPDSWTSKTDCPDPARTKIGACTVNNSGYIFGGTSGSNLKDTDQYTPDTWISKTDFSTARQFPQPFTIDSSAYLVDGSTKTGITEEYQPSGDSWTTKTSMPSPGRTWHNGGEVGGKGYIYYGIDSSNLQDCDEYNPSGDSWTSKTDGVAPARSLHAGATI